MNVPQEKNCKAGGSPVKYMTASAAGSSSSAGTVAEVVSFLFDYLG